MFLGIDIGTTSVKAVVIDERQEIVGSASAALSLARPHPGWSEQQPEDWWQASCGALDQLAAAHPQAIAKLAGIGLSGQMHGATLLDEADRVLRPAILWNDGRAALECTEIESALPDARRIAGNIAMPGFTAPKLAWLAKHEPATFARIRRVLLPKDYVRLKLTGEYVSDMSDASGTFWLDVGARRWSEALLAATGLERAQMPALVEGSEVSGWLRRELAERWGMSQAPVVAGGGGDNAATACGIGAVRPGAAFLSLGTSGVLFVSTARFAPATESALHAFCHAVPQVWHQMGVILAAADSLNWLARLLETSPADLIAGMGASVAAPSPTLFLPYLGGERTPHNDARARAILMGIGHETDRKALAQAVLEGVAFAFRDCLAALQAAGSDFERAIAVGGGAESRLWLSILANVLDRPLDRPQNSELGAAFGAARLGMAAASGKDWQALMSAPAELETVRPDRDLVERYAEAYARYSALYPATRAINNLGAA
jgi:xylulokinase